MARFAYVIEWVDKDGFRDSDDALEFYELSSEGVLRYQQTDENYNPQGIRTVLGVQSVKATATYPLD